MKKILLTLTALSLFSTVSARELMCEMCEEEPDPCCLPHLFVERSQIFANASLLYWTANEGVLDYAVKTEEASNLANTFALGHYKKAHYDWRPGFRVAASYYRCNRYWEVTTEYTWFQTHGSSRIDSPLNPTRETLAAAPFRSASSSIHLHNQVLDAYASRVFDPNEHLRIRAYTGITMGILNQTWRATYTNFANDFDRVKEKWSFWGGGLRVGSTVDWWWGGHFYFTGKVSSAALIGSYKNKTVQTNGNLNLLLSDAKYNHTRVAFHTQFMLGPSWQQPFECWSYEIFAGYELNLWFNLHERIRTEFNAPSAPKATFHSNSLLGLQGLTLRFTVGF